MARSELDVRGLGRATRRGTRLQSRVARALWGRARELATASPAVHVGDLSFRALGLGLLSGPHLPRRARDFRAIVELHQLSPEPGRARALGLGLRSGHAF